MKFGMRKPSLKRSLKARTTGRAKRALKKALIPGYGKKGMGWIKNPKKALYNKVYNKTTFSLGDVLRFGFTTKSKKKSKRKPKTKVMEGNANIAMEENVKVPFYKKKWFLILVSVFVPFIGIIFIWKSKDTMNKVLKIVLTAVVSLWSVSLLAVVFGGGETEEPVKQSETTTVISEESTTHAPIESTTAPVIVEESTTAENTTEATTEETTTKPTTQKETTTKKVTTTAKPTTTKKVTTTAKPTTTKKVTSEEKHNYILNINSDIFHNPDCPSVKKMNAENKEEFYGTREEAIDKGYNPCGNCHP